jgi:hypothetical protein
MKNAPAENPANDHAEELEKVNKVTAHFEKISDDKTLKREAQKFAEWLNQNGAFKKFRQGWDKLPHSVQWAILKGQQIVPMAPAWIETLIEMGLLKYKGHASPEERDEKINESREWNQKKTKWGLYIAGIFQPEIDAILPFLGPIEKLQNAKANVLESVRHHLDTLKIEKETEGKEHKIMENAPDGEIPYADAA